MGMAMVRRRIAGYAKVKGRKPRPPLPLRQDDWEMVGERARPYVPMVALGPRPAPPRSWWQKAWKPFASSVGVLLCCGFAYIVFNSSSRPSYRDATEAAQYPRTASASSGVSSSPRRSGRTSSYPGNEGAPDTIVLSNRSTPTDESFRASAYVRKKVSLPNISGDCVVKGSGSRDIGECLRQQGGQ